jgi:hypothetical protein
MFKPIYSCWVAEHSEPIGVIEFLGGALFGSLPNVSYSYFLNSLYEAGYTIIAQPFRLGLNHEEIAKEIFEERNRVLQNLGSSHQNIPRIWVGHSLGCKYIALLEMLGEGKTETRFPLKDQPSLLIAPDLSDIYGAVPIPPVAEYLKHIGKDVRPNRQEMATKLKASKRFGLTAILSFDKDDVAGTQNQPPETSDVAFITNILKETKENILITKEIPGKHLEIVGIRVCKPDRTFALVDLDVTDGILEDTAKRTTESCVIQLIEQLRQRLTIKVMTTNTINGKWIHRSYLSEVPFTSITDIQPDPAQKFIQKLIWATGELEATTDANGKVTGELKFPSEITLAVEGQITRSAEGYPDSFKGTGKGKVKKGETELQLSYLLEGWFIPDVTDLPAEITTKQTPTIVGSITHLGDFDPKRKPGYVGTFILVKVQD